MSSCKKEEKCNKKLKEANKLQKEIIKNITHEIRTPLTSIMGYSKILQETTLTEEQTLLLEKINSRSEELLCMFSDLLDYSAAVSNCSELTVRACNPCKVVRDCVDEYLSEAKDKNLELTVNCSGKSEMALFDDKKLILTLRHLLDNAVKFTHTGKIEVNIDYDDKLIVSIVDTGQGIAEEHFPIIFDEFTQLDFPKKSKPRGFGIGLSLVWLMLEAMGGQLFLSSLVNVGTAVTLIVPPLSAA